MANASTFRVGGFVQLFLDREWVPIIEEADDHTPVIAVLVPIDRMDLARYIARELATMAQDKMDWLKHLESLKRIAAEEIDPEVRHA